MSALFPTYNRFPVTVAKAEGTIVIDEKNKEYLDFSSGIGVCNLGHRHPDVQEAIVQQLEKYWHVSNLYHVPLQEKVAQLLTEASMGDYVFFCNSGAEANEAAIKLARKATGKTKIITCQKSFHGRTFATMSATGQDGIKEGFGPLLDTFEYVPYNDIEALQQAMDVDVAAVMLEVIQGEGGVVPGQAEFLKEVEKLCHTYGALMMVDEIQTGIGRTGKPFAYQHFDLSPDVITVAKGLGNGLPVGAMIAKETYGPVFGPGTHGSTFGGNPLAMAAAEVVLDKVFQSEFLEEVVEKGEYLFQKIEAAVKDVSFVTDVRGKGLMLGIVSSKNVTDIVFQLIDKGLLVLMASPYVIRLLPPLTVTKNEIDQAVAIIQETLVENDA